MLAAPPSGSGRPLRTFYGPEPDARPERTERPIDERLSEMRERVERRVRVQAQAVVVEALDVREAGGPREPLELPRRVAELVRAPFLARSAAAEPVLPVRLGQDEPPAGAHARGR